MKVYLDAPANMSRAMFRVAKALRVHAPATVEIVHKAEDADLQVLHVIGLEAVAYRSPARETAVIQYCVASGSPVVNWWHPLWERARVVWSYYDLTHDMPPHSKFYLAPLGYAPIFEQKGAADRDITVMTSGYVTGPGAEAIEEMAIAADQVGGATVHLGPFPVGWQGSRLADWKSIHAVPDHVLAEYYGRTEWVSGLRHIEGFEMPVLEGLMSGARPIVFDRPDMRRWFDGHAVFVPECSGQTLVDALVKVLAGSPQPVTSDEKREIARRFNWATIAEGFWQAAGVNQ